jgi:hypothetical protein
MPNHVATKLKVTGDDKEIKRFIKLAIREEKDETNAGEMITLFDFDKITPCHPDLHKAISPRRTGEDVFRARQNGDSEKDILEVMEQVKLSDDNEKKYGYANWYEFCNNEWGTKWGAYGFRIEQDEKGLFIARYETAWSPASPIFDKLATMFPTLSFEVDIADEGWGFAGTQIWENGEYSEEMLDGESIAPFMNEKFDANYVECNCGRWFNPEWYGDDQDNERCEECQEEK